jgi:hypothetical protein
MALIGQKPGKEFRTEVDSIQVLGVHLRKLVFGPLYSATQAQTSSSSSHMNETVKPSPQRLRESGR